MCDPKEDIIAVSITTRQLNDLLAYIYSFLCLTHVEQSKHLVTEAKHISAASKLKIGQLTGFTEPLRSDTSPYAIHSRPFIHNDFRAIGSDGNHSIIR